MKAATKEQASELPIANMTQLQLENVIADQLRKVLVQDREGGKIRREESKTFAEFLLETGLTRKEHDVDSVSLESPLLKYRKKDGEKPKWKVYLPWMTAAMQAVTGKKMMERAAQLGFIGTCFSSQRIKDEAKMIEDVKRARAGHVVPVCFSPRNTLDDIIKYMDHNEISTFPITYNGNPHGKVMGMITRYGIWRKEDEGKGIKIKERMASCKELKQHGTIVRTDDLRTLNEMMYKKGKKFLMVVNKKDRLKYMIFRKDLDQTLEKAFK